MFDLSGQQVLFRIAALLVIISFHGLFVALIAVWLGDKGPRFDGRVSINPMRHLEPIGALLLVIFRLGWIKPVAIDLKAFRWRFGGAAIVVLASLTLTILLAEALWLLRPALITSFSDSSAIRTLILMIETMARMTVWFAVVNIIPVPPLTGGLLLAAVAPTAYRFLDEKRLFIGIAFGVIAFAGAATDVLDTTVSALTDLLLR